MQERNSERERVDPRDPVVRTTIAKQDWFLTSEHLRQIPSTGGGAIYGAGRFPTYYSVRDLDRLAVQVHGEEGWAEKKAKRERRNAKRREKQAPPKTPPSPKKPAKKPKAAHEVPSLGGDTPEKHNLLAIGEWTPVSSNECESLALWACGKNSLRGEASISGCPVTLSCPQLPGESMHFKASTKTARGNRTQSIMVIRVLNRNKLHVEYSNGRRDRSRVQLDCDFRRTK